MKKINDTTKIVEIYKTKFDYKISVYENKTDIDIITNYPDYLNINWGDDGKIELKNESDVEFIQDDDDAHQAINEWLDENQDRFSVKYKTGEWFEINKKYPDTAEFFHFENGKFIELKEIKDEIEDIKYDYDDDEDIEDMTQDYIDNIIVIFDE